MNSNEYMAEYMRSRREQRRRALIEMAGGCCNKCSSIEVLEFDHRNKSTKKFSLSGSGLDKAWASVLEEFHKCDLLCYKCHREKTVVNKETGGGHNKIKDIQHGTMHCYQVLKCKCKPCKLAKSLYRKKQLSYNEVVEYPSDQ